MNALLIDQNAISLLAQLILLLLFTLYLLSLPSKSDSASMTTNHTDGICVTQSGGSLL